MEEIKYKDNMQIRLDKFLTNTYSEFSRTQWQKQINNKGVTVNDENVSVNHKLQTGDKIDIYSYPNFEFQQLPKLDIEIIAKTKDYLIVNKPSGLPVHPDNNYKKDTLIQRLLLDYPEIKKIENSDRPGVVHRLDKDVSGVMVIARNKKFFNFIKDQFQNHKVYKEYLGLVHEPMNKLEAEIKTRIERDKKTGKMKVRPINQTGRVSITEYEVIKNFTHFAYLKIVIKTGRTHQIRTLFRSLDHPIVGDTLYAKKKTKAHLDLKRPFLHAYKLGFYNMDNVWMEYEQELPEELTNIIKNLK